jgi:putative ABC transport system ATP-binding protein
MLQERPSKLATPLIEFRQVSRIYGTGTAAVRALNGVSFSINEGEFVAIMGPSGSGKSTAMNILGCLDTPSKGRFFFKGIDAGNLNRNRRTLLRRHLLGFVFQGFNLLPRTSAIENVELPLIYRAVPQSERRERSAKALEVVELTGREKHMTSELSGGEQQRVAIARAIVTNPAVIIADEPTGNLDTQCSNEIMSLLSSLNKDQGITVIMVTHETEMAVHAERIIRFRDGRITSDAKNKEIA